MYVCINQILTTKFARDIELEQAMFQAVKDFIKLERKVPFHQQWNLGAPCIFSLQKNHLSKPSTGIHISHGFKMLWELQLPNEVFSSQGLALCQYELASPKIAKFPRYEFLTPSGPPLVKMDQKIQYSLATSRGPRDGHHVSAQPLQGALGLGTSLIHRINHLVPGLFRILKF